MELSDRAKSYITELKKDADYSASREETIIYLEKQNFQKAIALIEFQSEYSGYTLVNSYRERGSFCTYLFSRHQIENNISLELEELNGKFLFECGQHERNPFDYVISHKGEFGTYHWRDQDLNILHNSYKSIFEISAFKNEIYNDTWIEHRVYHRIKDFEKFNSFIDLEFEAVKECSDDFSKWWKNDDIVIDNGRWLGRPENYFHIFYKKEKYKNQIIERLQKEGIIQ